MQAKVTVENGKFNLFVHFLQNDLAKSAPNRKYIPSKKCWELPASIHNVNYLLRSIGKSCMDDDSISLANKIIEENKPIEIDDNIPPSVFNGCRKHQEAAIKKAWKHQGFAFFHRMRTGKTFTTIRLANARYFSGHIDAMLVICPTSIKEVWKNQYNQWSQVNPINVFVLESGGNQKYTKWEKESNGFKFLVIGVEALSSGSAFSIAKDFVSKHKVMCVSDESTRIKNHKAARTEKAHELADNSVFRVILTGSEITRGIEDLYAQYRFIGESIIGHHSFFTFRNRHCVMGGFEGRQIVGYANVDELMNKLAPYTDVVEMKDVVELPPKEYQTRYVKPSEEQVKLIKSLKTEFFASIGGDELTVDNALSLITRCQQITGGSFPSKTETGWKADPLKVNPKLDELMDLLEEVTGKVIVWCRFRIEIALVVAAIDKKYGGVVQFHGGMTPKDREDAKREFQENPNVRYIVANTQTGAMGIELSAADFMIYYSNSYNYEDRVQSEERATSIFKKSSIGIIDIVMDVPVDRQIISNLGNKQSMASFVSKNLKDLSNII